jgi:hypothetical protein
VQLRTHAHPPAPFSPQYQNVDRPKRGAQDAFGEDNAQHYLPREDPNFSPNSSGLGGQQGAIGDSENEFNNTNGVQDLSTRLMAHMLGLEVPGVEPSTSYYPGSEWWPRNQQGVPQPPQGAQVSGGYPEGMEFAPTAVQVMNQNLQQQQQLQQQQVRQASPNWVAAGPEVYSTNNMNYQYDYGQYAV